MMRLATLLGPDLHETLANDPDELIEALEEFHPEDIAELVEDLPAHDAVALMRALPEEMGARVLERLGESARSHVLETVRPEEASSLLAEMSADDRVDAIQDLPDALAEALLAQIERTEPEVADETRELVRYGHDTAGGIMTTEYIGLPPETKIWQAVEEVRRSVRDGSAETANYIYISAFGEKLLGVVSLKELILADPSQALADIMRENVVRVHPDMAQAEVAQAIAKYDLSAIPVVDSTGRMHGVVTVDDVVDVVIEEATEDVQRLGGVVPIEDGYLETGHWVFVRSRATWLVVLFLGGLLTATVMRAFEGAMSKVLELVLFVPLIISAGGNSGSQSSSLIIRALAVGEVTPKNWSTILIRESLIGISLGAILGVVGFVRVLFGGGTHVLMLAATVGASVIAVVVAGAMVGAMMPLFIKKIGFDPAISSTPFIASLVDVLGLVVYFSIASVIFLS